MRTITKLILCAVVLVAAVGGAPTMAAAADCDDDDDQNQLPTAPSDDSGCEDDHDSRTAQTPTTDAPPSDDRSIVEVVVDRLERGAESQAGQRANGIAGASGNGGPLDAGPDTQNALEDY